MNYYPVIIVGEWNGEEHHDQSQALILLGPFKCNSNAELEGQELRLTGFLSKMDRYSDLPINQSYIRIMTSAIRGLLDPLPPPSPLLPR
jgi:hypothetical protein